MTTYYDILGVVPAITAVELAAAYKAAVLDQFTDDRFDDMRFEHATSMWRGPRLDKIAELTDAYRAINHGDRRDRYNRELVRLSLICPVCQGRGRIIEDGLTQIQCAACKGTGKGFEIEP